MAALVAEIAVITSVTVVLSVLTRFWLTYVDFGVCLVVRRPIRGMVELGRCYEVGMMAH